LISSWPKKIKNSAVKIIGLLAANFFVAIIFEKESQVQFQAGDYVNNNHHYFPGF